MKYKFKVQIRGNVEYESRSALQAALAEKLSAIEGLTIISRSIELWQENGVAGKYEFGHRFTIQLIGNLLADNDAFVEALIDSFCQQYPEFVLTYQDVTAWQDGFGGLKKFNDDGTEYFASAPQTVDETDGVLTVEKA